MKRIKLKDVVEGEFVLRDSSMALKVATLLKGARTAAYDGDYRIALDKLDTIEHLYTRAGAKLPPFWADGKTELEREDRKSRGEK